MTFKFQQIVRSWYSVQVTFVCTALWAIYLRSNLPNLFKIRRDLRKLWRNTFWCVLYAPQCIGSTENKVNHQTVTYNDRLPRLLRPVYCVLCLCMRSVLLSYLFKLLYFVRQRTSSVLQARTESGLETPQPIWKVMCLLPYPLVLSVWCNSLNRVFEAHAIKAYKSPLPLTDPRDAVPHAHRAVHRCGRSVW